MTTDNVAELGRLGIIPVIVIDDPDRAVPLADALAEGGLAVRGDHVSNAAEPSSRCAGSPPSGLTCWSARARC